MDGPEGRYEGTLVTVGMVVGTAKGTRVGAAVIAVVLGAGYKIKSFVLTVLWELAHAILIVTLPVLGIMTVTELLPLGIIRKLLHIPFAKLPDDIWKINCPLLSVRVRDKVSEGK